MNLKLLEELSNIAGVSGYEQGAQKVVAEHLRPTVDEMYQDRLDNVIGIKRAVKTDSDERPLRVVIAAHVDEYGMWVSHIEDNGFIHLTMISGAPAAVLMGHQIEIATASGPVVGVVAPKFGNDGVKLKDLRLDTGRDGDWVRDRVKIGDVATLKVNYSQLNDKIVCSRNFDNRLGLFCMLEAAKRLGDVNVDLYLVSSTQEEVGIRGVPPAIFEIDPDVGLAVDGGVTKDAYNAPPTHHCELGAGTSIYVHDRLSFGNPTLLDHLYDVSDKAGFAWQKNFGGGTDASAIQRVGSGAWSTTVGAPVRYMHSSVQLAHLDDVETTIQLLVAFIESAHELAPKVRKPWTKL